MAPERPDARQDVQASTEAPWLSGHSDGNVPGRLPGTHRAPPAADAPADLRSRLQTADAEGVLRILAETQAHGSSAAPLILDLVALLQHEDARVKQAAADALASMGQAVVAPLLRAVIEEYDRAGHVGAPGSWAMSWGPYVLAKVGEPAVLHIAETLGHTNAYFFAFVTFQRLSLLRTPLSAATDVVIRRLGEVDEEQPLCFVIDAVPYLGPDSARAVPQLADLLHNPRQRVRTVAAKALGRIGRDAAGALTELDRLRAATSERDGTWRRVLDETIAQIRGER